MKLYWYYIAISLSLEALAENETAAEIADNKTLKPNDTISERT